MNFSTKKDLEEILKSSFQVVKTLNSQVFSKTENILIREDGAY